MLYRKRCITIAGKYFLKKGYFFVIDAVLALSVLAIGILLAFTLYSNVPSKEQSTVLSEDLMDFLVNNKIKDTDNTYASVNGQLWNSGKITNAENTLLQQAAEFYAINELDIANQFIAELTKNSLPSQYTFELWINKKLIYPKEPSQQHQTSKNQANVLIPSKKIVYGILNKDDGSMFGPYDAEVLVWQ
ncbi:hypothetical protein HYX01_03290 [Candidatus Woesearchaeota archaeon]|nr:hypothetical protein [Candidatus Woesearchaeota archaeon]